MMKIRVFTVVFCSILAFAVPLSAQLKYVDAARLTLVGKAMPTPENIYHRVDTVKYNNMPFQVKRLFTHTAGLAIAFKTNSTTVAARWETWGGGVMGNMTPIAHKGLDLYMKHDGRWIPAGVGIPSAGKIHEGKIAQNLEAVPHEFLLYLPLLEGITSLEIGVDSASFIEAVPSPFRHRVVLYGSSILHGACASRAGLAYPAQMSRNTGIDFINFGVSGNGKIEAAVADMLKDIDADAFVLDCMPNPSPEEITERMGYMVKTIRKYHPGVPIIMIESYMRENGYSNSAVRERCINQGKAFVEQYEQLKNEGVDDLHLIRDNHAIGTDHEGSVDGTHPNDLGFERMARQYQPQMMAILKPYGIE